MLSVSALDCLIFAKKGSMNILSKSLPVETPYKAYIYCVPFPANSIETPAVAQFVSTNGDESICIFSKENYSDGYKSKEADKAIICGTVIGECTCYDAKIFDAGNSNLLVDAYFSGLCLYNENFMELSDFFRKCNKSKGTDCSVCKESRLDSCKALTTEDLKNRWCYIESPVKNLFTENLLHSKITTEDAISILNVLADNPCAEKRVIDKREIQRALILAIQALNKDIAQKVDFEITPSGESCEFYCPNCMENLTSYPEFSKCPDCGQSLDLQPVHDFLNSKR